jgi:two-component system nitrogen regulation response regulator NtrX
VDVRVITATNKNLQQEIASGRFREDLFYRLNVIPFFVPPLRDRREDIPVMADYFMRIFSAEHGRKPKEFSLESLDALADYSWPGNVRELRNIIERLLLFASNGEVDIQAVSMALPGAASTSPSTPESMSGSLAERVAGYEREVVLGELKRHNYHITNAARALGLERSHLYKKCQQLGIDLAAVRGGS